MKVFVAGHRGMVGSAIARRLGNVNGVDLITRSRAELDLTDSSAVETFFAEQRPQQVYLAAAKVGGIWANEHLPAEFIQVDLLVANDDVLIAVECKSKMTHDYVDQHVERMGKLKRMLPAYRHHQAFGAVAAMVMPTDVVHYAQNQGFYVLVQSGETLTICNDPSFSATAW